MPKNVAIIGGGLSGSSAAFYLKDQNYNVTIFDKARGIGGRLSNRRRSYKDTVPLQFDLGAQYIVQRETKTETIFNFWKENGHIKPWPVSIGQWQNGQLSALMDQPNRYIGTPSMTALVKSLTQNITTHTEKRITHLSKNKTWSITTDQGQVFDGFDYIILALPLIQAIDLLPENHSFHKQLDGIIMQPSWTVLCALANDTDLPNYGGMFINNHPMLQWVGMNHTKPDRPKDMQMITLHCTSDWSEKYLEEKPETIIGIVLEEACHILQVKPKDILWTDCHRWRYAVVEQALNQSCLYDPTLGIGLCGDWCLGNRAELAILSGHAISHAIIEGHTNNVV